jgi:hypothetical protein
MKGKGFKLKAVLAVLIVALLAIGLTACGGGSENEKAHENQANIRQRSFAKLSKQEPVEEATFSPTRRTINFWTKTWGHDPNKLSYVYLQADNGQLTGYYVFKGLPVSECAAMTETYEFVDPKNDEHSQDFMVPAPGMDGAYYSGGQCSVYYGIDALSGQYMEFSLSGGQSFLLYEKPLPKPEVEPLGFTTIQEVKEKES